MALLLASCAGLSALLQEESYNSARKELVLSSDGLRIGTADRAYLPSATAGGHQALDYTVTVPAGQKPGSEVVLIDISFMQSGNGYTGGDPSKSPLAAKAFRLAHGSMGASTMESIAQSNFTVPPRQSGVALPHPVNRTGEVTLFTTTISQLKVPIGQLEPGDSIIVQPVWSERRVGDRFAPGAVELGAPELASLLDAARSHNLIDSDQWIEVSASTFGISDPKALSVQLQSLRSSLGQTRAKSNSKIAAASIAQKLQIKNEEEALRIAAKAKEEHDTRARAEAIAAEEHRIQAAARLAYKKRYAESAACAKETIHMSTLGATARRSPEQPFGLGASAGMANGYVRLVAWTAVEDGRASTQLILEFLSMRQLGQIGNVVVGNTHVESIPLSFDLSLQPGYLQDHILDLGHSGIDFNQKMSAPTWVFLDALPSLGTDLSVRMSFQTGLVEQVAIPAVVWMGFMDGLKSEKIQLSGESGGVIKWAGSPNDQLRAWGVRD